MSKANLNELSVLRKLYEDEKRRREDYYSEMIKQAKDEYSRSLDIDYIDEFKEEFEVSLVSLEKLYDELVELYRVTKGLTFSITSYIKTVAPRPIAKGRVEEHFDMLVEECKGALADINDSACPEEDIPPIKVFCQGLIDLRYIVQNARQLIIEAGNAEQKKQARLNQLRERIDYAREQYDENLKLENFDCYRKLKSYADDVIAGSRVVSDSVLKNEKIEPRNDFKFLMGFHTENIPDEDLRFATGVLGIDSSAFSTNPIFFNLKPGHTSLLINAPSAFFSEFDFDDLIRNIYFSFASNLPAKDLLISCVEHESVSDAVLASLENTIKKEVNDNKSEDGIYITTAKKDDDIMNMISEIKSLTNLRSMIYRTNKVKSIFDYNELDALSTDFYVLYMVNHYPNGFTNTRMNGAEELRRMATDNGVKGVITVICQATDAAFTEAMPMLTAEELGADCIDVSLEKSRGMLNITYRYNGEPASLNIRAPKGQFDESTYWKTYTKFYNTASTVWLYDILEKFGDKPKKPIYEQLSIPVGFSEGMPFEYSVETCSVQDFGIVTGKSGSGKSSFLHTLILGAASRYSPEELRIRLVDFKAEADSPEFSQYMKKKGVENLYLPHVDYLLVNGKAECALDLFKMIKDIKVERNTIMNRINCTEYSKYMKDPRVQAGNDPNLPKLPFLLYIIDEYNLMINGDKRSSSVKQAIVDNIEETVKAVRAYGVGVIFSGQTVADDMDNALSQMDSRIALMNNSVVDYQALMGKPSREDASIDLAFLRGKGYSVFSTDAGKTRRRVRHAYAGYTGCKEQLEFTRKIREKYGETEQVVAGSEKLFNISEEEALNKAVEGNGNLRMHIPIGVTSASMVKSYLEFADGKDSLNYYAFADTSQLYALERNAMFGYLNEMVNLGYKSPKVTYFAEDGVITDCLGSYLDKYSSLKKNFNFFKSHDQIAREIANFYDVYMERNDKKSKMGGKDFEPILIVMHDVEWLSDRDESWVRYANSDESDEVEKESQSESEEDEVWAEAERQVMANKAYARFNDQMKKQLIKQMVEELKGQSKPKVKKTKIDRSNFSASDYVEMFNTLYTRGNRCAIYMLVCSENYTPIYKSILNEMESKEVDNAKNRYSVYGSEKEFTEEIRDGGANKECIYVCPSKAKTRLYDYDIKNNDKFWQDFVDKIN